MTAPRYVWLAPGDPLPTISVCTPAETHVRGEVASATTALERARKCAEATSAAAQARAVSERAYQFAFGTAAASSLFLFAAGAALILVLRRWRKT